MLWIHFFSEAPHPDVAAEAQPKMEDTPDDPEKAETNASGEPGADDDRQRSKDAKVYGTRPVMIDGLLDGHRGL